MRPANFGLQQTKAGICSCWRQRSHGRLDVLKRRERPSLLNLESLGAPGMRSDDLRFETIDLRRDANVCVAFRRDSFVCSFGSDDRFFAEYGPDGGDYLKWLGFRINEHPLGHVHVWQNSLIIGQIEMRLIPDLPISGYVNLYYLIPEVRGSGAASALQQYALSFFRQGSAEVARLRVSPTNARAVAFYHKHGWRDLGPDSKRGNVHVMELEVNRARQEGA